MRKYNGIFSKDADELNNEIFAIAQAAALINAGLDEIDSGAKPAECKEFFDAMRAKYGE